MAYPKLLHHNIIAQAASVVASSTASGMAVANLSDGRPYTWWGPSAAPASIEIDAGVATEADFLYIPTHTLDSTLWDVSLYAADLPFSGTQLLTFPEDFSNAAWAKTSVTVSANATTAPDGTSTADKLVEAAALSAHYLQYSGITTIVGNTYTCSVYVKAAERTRGYIDVSDGVTGSAIVIFNLSTGGISTASSGSWTNVTGTIIRCAGDFYRITITGTVGAGTGILMAIALQDAAGNNSYTGDGVSGFYIWGAIANLGSTAAPYIPQTAGRWISETAVAFSSRVQDPADISVSGGTASITAGAAWAPNGEKQAALVDDTSLAAAQYGVVASFVELHSNDGFHTASIFIKKTINDANYCCLYSAFFGVAGVEQYLVIDTNSGAISSVFGSPQDYGIEDAGDYWWVWLQCSTSTGGGNSNVDFVFYPAWNTTGATSIDVATTGGKYVWGAKLEKTTGRPAPYRQDAPIFLPFAAATKRYWLLRLNRKSGSALCAMSVCMIGKALTMPTGLPQGYDPVGRKVVGQRNRNERGQPLGTAVDYKWRRQTLRFQALSWAWVRGVFARLWDNGLASEPVGFIWDYEAHVEDVQHVTLGEEFRTPHKSGQLCDLEFDVEGVVE